MNSCVLDSSVIIKGFFDPNPSLSSDIYKREKNTHFKCSLILKHIEESHIFVYIPKVCVVEVAAVSRRFSDKKTSQLIAARTYSSCCVIGEEELFSVAWSIAEEQSSSGFDSYFIALASMRNIPLLTDDAGMHVHAIKRGVNSILIRESNEAEIKKLFLG
ncbi:MAG: type II toxin-antitoxin system VapC family toxin [Methanospirillaceae archaeon]|nr:type II toxin-antitoxin system VapC family toxin [Methanospirillaceae archaeon]